MEVPAPARALAEDLARALGVDGLAFDEDGTLTLELDDRILVCAALEHGGEALTLFAPVTAGPLADPGLTRRALEANFLWRGAGGATLAVEPGSGQLALLRRVPLAGLGYPAFAELLEAFADQAAAWADEAAESAAAEAVDRRDGDGREPRHPARDAPQPPLLFDPRLFA